MEKLSNSSVQYQPLLSLYSFSLKTTISSLFDKGSVKCHTENGLVSYFMIQDECINVVSNGKFVHKFEVPAISSFAVHGDKMFALDLNGMLAIFDLISKTLVNSFKVSGINCPCSFIGHFRDSLIGIGLTDGTVRIVDIRDSKVVFKAKLGPSDIITGIISYDPNIYIVSVSDGKLFAFKNSRLLFSVAAHESMINRILIDNSNRLITAGADKTISIWTVRAAEFSRSSQMYFEKPVLDLIKVGDHYVGMAEDFSTITFDSAFSKIVSKSFFFSEKLSSCFKISQIDLSSSFILLNDTYIASWDSNFKLSSLSIVRFDQVVNACFLKPNLQVLFTASCPELVSIDDISSNNVRIFAGSLENCLSIAYSPSLIAAGCKDGNIFVWQRSTTSLILFPEFSLVGHSGSVSSLCFSKDGKFLYSGSSDLTIKRWSVESRASIWTVKAHNKDINYIDCHPVEDVLLSASQDKTVAIRSASNGQMIDSLSGHGRSVWCAKFDSTGSHIISSSADKSIKLWSYGTRQCIRTLESHSASVLALAYLEGHEKIVSCSSNGIIQIHDAFSSQLILSLDEHMDRIWSLDVSVNDEYLLSASDDCSIKIWQNDTSVEREQRVQAHNEELKAEQELRNSILRRDLLRSLQLSLKLKKGQTAVDILFRLIRGTDYKSMVELLGKLSKELDPSLVLFLGQLSKDWNAYFGRMVPAQLVFRAFLPQFIKNNQFAEQMSILDAAIAHSEQHLQKIDDMLVDVNLGDLICPANLK